MLLEFFIHTAGSAGVVAFGLFLARNWILTRLKAAVEYEYASKLAALNSELRSSEETIKSHFAAQLAAMNSELRAAEEEVKADLSAKQRTIDFLRDSTVKTLGGRASEFDKRRFAAIDQIWATCNELNAFAGLVTFRSLLDVTPGIFPNNAAGRQKIEKILEPYDWEKLSKLNALAARPYVSDLAWAYFQARFTLIVGAHLQIDARAKNFGSLADPVHPFAMLRAALPEIQPLVADGDWGAANTHMDTLSERLFMELRKMLEGADLDQRDAAKAAEVLRLANTIQRTNLEIEAEAKATGE